MEKIAENTLSLSEKKELSNYIRDLENSANLVNKWVVPGTQTPIFVSPFSDPYMVYWFDADLPDMFSISNSTWTALDLTDSRLTIKKSSPCSIKLDGTKIYATVQSSYIAFLGRVLFNTNATGTRHVSISYYDSTDTLIERRMLSAESSIGATSGTPVPMCNFRPAISPLSTDPNQYFKIEVYQDSGGSLGVCGIDFVFFRVF